MMEGCSCQGRQEYNIALSRAVSEDRTYDMRYQHKSTLATIARPPTQVGEPLLTQEQTLVHLEVKYCLTVDQVDSDGDWCMGTLNLNDLTYQGKTVTNECNLVSVPIAVSRSHTNVSFSRKDGILLTDAEKTALGLFVTKKPPYSDDEIYGAQDAVSVGDKWDVSTVRLAETLNSFVESPCSFDSGSVRGMCQLTGVRGLSKPPPPEMGFSSKSMFTGVFEGRLRK